MISASWGDFTRDAHSHLTSNLCCGKIEGEDVVLRENLGWGGVKSRSKREKAQKKKKSMKAADFGGEKLT